MVKMLVELGGGDSSKKAGVPENPAILFAFGDCGKFSSSSGGTPSLDSSFSKYAVHKLRSLGHLVVGIDEWGTSQRDPNTLGKTRLVKKSRVRLKQSVDTGQFFHRDVMAGQAIAVIAMMLLLGRQLPVCWTRPTLKDLAEVTRSRDS